MSILVLQKIGLTPGEAKVYLALVKNGEQTKSTLSSNANVSSSKVYEIAEKLIKKGLAASIIKNNKKYYSGSKPEELNKFIERKEEALRQEKEIVKNIIPKLKSTKETKKTIIQVFEGWDGYETTISEGFASIPNKGTIKGIGVEMPRIDKLHQYHKARRAKNLKQELIFPEKKMSKTKYKDNDRRYIAGISKIGLGIFPDRVIIQTLGKEPISIVIQNSDVVDSFKQIHAVLWEKAKK